MGNQDLCSVGRDDIHGEVRYHGISLAFVFWRHIAPNHETNSNILGNHETV